jgi:hypothetical protein
MIHIVMNFWTFNQGIPIVTLYSYFSILVGKISNVFLQILEYLLTDQGFESPSELIFLDFNHKLSFSRKVPRKWNEENVW